MKKSNVDEFIKKAMKKHGNKYNYSKVNYINSLTKVCIICPIHGEFWQRPDMHLSRNGCKLCSIGDRTKKLSLTTDDFIKKAINVHGNRYDYSKVSYTKTEEKVKIICDKHGIFFQTPHKHLNGHGCPKCASSKGEEVIRNYLIENNISFIEQKRFKNCRKKTTLPFDFFLPEKNMVIEYNGELHYFKSRRKNGQKKLNETIANDEIKAEFCEINDIKLVIIPFFINNITGVLNYYVKNNK